MNSFVFAWRRMLRKPATIVMSACIILVLALAGQFGRAVELPVAGVYDAAQTEESRRIVDHLVKNGFVECTHADTMRDWIASGQLDCAAVLPEDLVKRMEDHALEGSVVWYVSPTAFVPDLYKDQVAAALYSEYVPYLTSTFFEGTNVTREMVVSEYQEMLDAGYVFSFDVMVTQKGNGETEVEAGTLVTGATALLLFVLVVSFCTELVDGTTVQIAQRIGINQALKRVVVPHLATRALLSGLVCSVGLLLAGEEGLLGPAVVYIVALFGIGLCLAGSLCRARYVYVFAALVILGSLAVCPVYLDLSILFPVIEVVRFVFPTYWLWAVVENPALWCMLALTVLVIGVCSLRASLVARRLQCG